MEYIVSNWETIVAACMAVVILARILVKLTPTPADDTFVEKIVTFLKHLGLHIDSGK